eukprot:1969446-Rhodomonas_salina.2
MTFTVVDDIYGVRDGGSGGVRLLEGVTGGGVVRGQRRRLLVGRHRLCEDSAQGAICSDDAMMIA